MDTLMIEDEIALQLVNSRKYKDLNAAESLCCAVSGLCEESGEVAGLLNRATYKHKEVPDDRWVDELGDVLWYVTAVAILKGLSLQELYESNTRKLQKRYGETYADRENRNPGSK